MNAQLVLINALAVAFDGLAPSDQALVAAEFGKAVADLSYEAPPATPPGSPTAAPSIAHPAAAATPPKR